LGPGRHRHRQAPQALSRPNLVPNRALQTALEAGVKASSNAAIFAAMGIALVNLTRVSADPLAGSAAD
jgi:hypothetical protein